MSHQADVVERAVDSALGMNDTKKLNGGEFLENIVWANGEMLWESQKGQKLDDSDSGAEAGRV